MKNFLELLILFLLVSLIKGEFYYDKRLLKKNKIGRDFVGSVEYGSFIYLGSCPSTIGALPDVSVAAADPSNKCFTDSSIAEITVGYICETIDGSNSKIHFSFPGENGFVVGGTKFGGSLTAKTGYKWGSVGTPTYTDGGATASCEKKCTSKYCDGKCTVDCSDTKTSSGEKCEDTTGKGETHYFVKDDQNPTNCGELKSCCTTFSFSSSAPPSCPGESLFTQATDFVTSFGNQGNFELGNVFKSDVAGKITDVKAKINSADTNVANIYSVTLWKVSNKNIIGTKEIGPITSTGLISVVFDSPVSIDAFAQYIVSITMYSGNFKIVTKQGNILIPNGHLTYVQSQRSLSIGSYPINPDGYFPYLDVIFVPDSCQTARKSLDSNTTSNSSPILPSTIQKDFPQNPSIN